jgi:hypothetical protein
LAAEDTDGVVDGEEGGMDSAQVFDVGNPAETLQQHSVAALMHATTLPY